MWNLPESLPRAAPRLIAQPLGRRTPAFLQRCFKHALIHVGGPHADPQVAHSDSIAACRKQRLQQGRPLRSAHAHQQLRTSSRQRKAKAVHCLEVLHIVHSKHRQLTPFRGKLRGARLRCY